MSFEVLLALGEQGADATRLEVLHRQIRDEVGQLDNVDITIRHWPVAAGQEATVGGVATAPLVARGVDPATVNAVAMAVLGSGGLTAVVTSARAWLGREQNHARTVRLELADDVLELTGASTEEQDRLVELFLCRHELRRSP